MFIQLTAYGHGRLINLNHIVHVWPEKVFNDPGDVPAYQVVTRIQLTNAIIDVTESYDEVLQIIKGI